MKVRPSELASALLQRRVMLKESLPGVIRNLEAEEEVLAPRVERMRKSFDEANNRVAKHKAERDKFQNSAVSLIPIVKQIRTKLMDAGGMISLDPKWKNH